MQTRLENNNANEIRDWTKFSFWCTPEGLGGEKIRFGLRKAVPLGLASLIGLSMNQLTIVVLSNHALVFSLSLADLIATLSGVLAFGVIDGELDRCWPTDYKAWQTGFQVLTPHDPELGQTVEMASYNTGSPQV